MLYGPDGKEISSAAKGSNKPNYDRLAVASVRDRWYTYPSQGLTPERLARIFKEADAGDVYRQAELFEEMEGKDTHLFAELQKRKLAVLSLDWEVMSYSESRIDKKAADLVRAALEFEGLEDSLLDVMDALGKGYSVSEIMWQFKNDQVLIQSLDHVPPRRITFGKLGEIRLLTEDNLVTGIELPENKFVAHLHRALSGHPSRSGLIRICAWMYLFKNYDIKDWVTFCEVYGMPIRLGKYDASATKEDRDALVAAVTQLGTDAAGIISKSTEIEFIQMVKDAKNIYESLAEFCNKEMSKAILGQTLTADVGDTGSYAASQTHNEVRRDLLKADAKALAETLRRYLIRPLVRFNLGSAPNLPYIKFDLSEPEDLEKEAKVYSVLISEIGLPVSKKHVYEKFGIPEPEEGEELLAPPSPFGGFPGQVPMNTVANKDVRPTGITSPPGNPQPLLDALGDTSRDLASQAMESILSPVKELITSGASLEEIQERLPQIYGEMATEDLEELVARTLFMADLYGRWIAGAKTQT